MKEARLGRDSLPTERELESSERAASCRARAGLLLLPGLMQVCRGRSSEGMALASLAVAELGAAVTGGVTNGLETSAAGVPSIALGDLLKLSLKDVALENQRSSRVR